MTISSAFASPAAVSVHSNVASLCCTVQRPRACATPPISDPQIVLHRRAFLAAAAAAVAGATLDAGPAQASAWNPREHNVLFDSSSGSFIPTSSLRSLLARYRGTLFDRCIIAGEVHDRPRTHAAQLAVLRSAAALPDGRPLVVGFEQFYRAHNPFLEQYASGQISLSALLKVTMWEQTWGYDPKLYEPIFRWCRANGARMVGLNVPRSLVTYVSKVGLNGLSPELRSFLPSDMDVTNLDHFRAFVHLIGLDAHALGTRGPDMRLTLRNWFEAQCTWDEYMAETVRQTCQARPDARVVALIGTGHVEGRVGFPNRIQKRLAERPLTIVPREVRWVSEEGFPMPDIYQPETDVADIVWYTNRQIDMT